MTQHPIRTPVSHGTVAGQLAMNRRTLLRSMGVGALALMGGGLVACGPGDASDPADPAGSAVDPEDAAGTFDFTTYSGAYEDATATLVTDYMEDTGATIGREAFPFNEYLNQVIIQGQGGNMTGAVQLDVAWMHAVAQLGILRDLGPYADGVDYTDTALTMGQVDGVQYGLPWQLASIGMVGNAELLDRAGVPEPPATITDFENALQSLKELDGDIIPYGAMTAVAQLKDIMAWMWTFGSDIIDNGDVTLGDEGSVRAVEWFKGLADEGLIAPDLDRFDARALFPQGNMGFYEDAILARQILTDDTPDFEENIVVVPRPVDGSGDPQTMLWGSVIAVIEDDNADAAALFAQHMTSDLDTTLELFGTNAVPPTTQSAVDSDAVQQDDYVSTWNGEVTQFARVNPFWPYAEFGAMEDVLSQQVQRALVGDATPQEAMDRAAEEISELMDQ